MKITKIELPFNYFHFVLMGLIIFILALNNNYCYLLFIPYLIYVYKDKKVFITTLVVLLCSILCLVLEVSELNTNEFYATILSIEEKSYTNKLELKTKNHQVIAYLSKDINVEVGDYGYYVCTKSTYSSRIYNGSFDYNEYLYNSYISGVYFVDSYQYLNNKFVISKVQNNISNYFNSNLENETLKYSLMLILGIDSFSEEESDILSNLGIMHLFCISGMHINFILMLVSVILSKFRVRRDRVEITQVIFALVLLVITNFSLSVTRAFLMFSLAFIFKKKNINASTLDVLSISAIIILLFRPRYLFLISFQLTFLVTFMIVITSDLYNKSLIKSLLIQSTIAFATTFPLIVNINYEINLLTILYSTFISIPFSYIIMPITFLSAGLSTNFFNPLFVLFDNALTNFSSIDYFIFRVSKLSIVVIIIYYLLFYFILKSIYIKKHLYKYLTLLCCFLFCIINSSYLNNETTVTFFDVEQGDSALISLAYNKGNILIDCYNGVGDFIKTRGIKTIDYVIITHAHNDHMGDLEVIKANYDVKGVVCSYYDQDSKKLNCDSYVSGGDKLELSYLTLNFIAPYTSNSDINQASLVFTTIINGYTFMFTGDTTSEVEYVMLEKDLNLKCDVLKVAHHGSSTSSCVEFVEASYPKYAIFSYGENNSYGLPNAEVISRFYMSENYHTPIDGSIQFYYKNKWQIRLYN